MINQENIEIIISDKNSLSSDINKSFDKFISEDNELFLENHNIIIFNKTIFFGVYKNESKL